MPDPTTPRKVKAIPSDYKRRGNTKFYDKITKNAIATGVQNTNTGVDTNKMDNASWAKFVAENPNWKNQGNAAGQTMDTVYMEDEPKSGSKYRPVSADDGTRVFDGNQQITGAYRWLTRDGQDNMKAAQVNTIDANQMAVYQTLNRNGQPVGDQVTIPGNYLSNNALRGTNRLYDPKVIEQAREMNKIDFKKVANSVMGMPEMKMGGKMKGKKMMKYEMGTEDPIDPNDPFGIKKMAGLKFGDSPGVPYRNSEPKSQYATKEEPKPLWHNDAIFGSEFEAGLNKNPRNPFTDAQLYNNQRAMGSLAESMTGLPVDLAGRQDAANYKNFNDTFAKNKIDIYNEGQDEKSKKLNDAEWITTTALSGINNFLGNRDTKKREKINLDRAVKMEAFAETYNPYSGGNGSGANMKHGGTLQNSPEMAKGGYINKSGRYVHEDGKTTSKRGLWANVHMKDKRMEDGGVIDSGTDTQVLGGGRLEQISESTVSNPMMEARGNTHPEGGIDIQHGDKPANIEHGEVVWKDNTDALHVFGKLKMPGTNKTFKTIAKDLASEEDLINKGKLKAINVINNTDPKDKYLGTAFETAKIMFLSHENQSKEIAGKKQELASYQSAILGVMNPETTKGKYGLEIPMFAKGGSITLDGISPQEKKAAIKKYVYTNDVIKNGKNIGNQTLETISDKELDRLYNFFTDKTIDESLKSRVKIRNVNNGKIDVMVDSYNSADKNTKNYAKQALDKYQLSNMAEVNKTKITVKPAVKPATKATVVAPSVSPDPQDDNTIIPEETVGPDKPSAVLASNNADEVRIQKVIDKYSNKKSPLNAKDFIEVANKYNVPIDLMLAQGIQESNFGTKGRAARTNNIFNVGNVDNGTNENQKDWKAGLERYAKVMKNEYSTNGVVDVQGLINSNFTRPTRGGNYASNSQYGNRIASVLNDITSTKNYQSPSNTGAANNRNTNTVGNPVSYQYNGVFSPNDFRSKPITSEAINTGTPAQVNEQTTNSMNPEITKTYSSGKTDPSSVFIESMNKKKGYQSPLDIRQITPELLTIASNYRDPVTQLSYQPELKQTFDMSYQLGRNENQSNFNQLSKIAGQTGNIDSLYALGAQGYKANETYNMSEVQTNAQQKLGVYGQNTDTLNDAKLKNLQMINSQQEKIDGGKAIQQARFIKAIDSMGVKGLQNKLENKVQNAYETLYPTFGVDNMGNFSKDPNKITKFLPGGSAAIATILSNGRELPDKEILKTDKDGNQSTTTVTNNNDLEDLQKARKYIKDGGSREDALIAMPNLKKYKL